MQEEKTLLYEHDKDNKWDHRPGRCVEGYMLVRVEPKNNNLKIIGMAYKSMVRILVPPSSKIVELSDKTFHCGEFRTNKMKVYDNISDPYFNYHYFNEDNHLFYFKDTNIECVLYEEHKEKNFNDDPPLFFRARIK
ncbi:hypothetical protein QLL95_gp0346 [Cotonvirus japonicus]|uniref:Uncharacterized protein n=1 Tax=Cotonvirus japonicus TaxID=2811091 RepID=A0ABM7NUN0_9VIRU|nr:hypothetical protein QLL95_gp0346 [Cotonvirus japonicus]BCS83777.1 hypothetical protein [Cotonvirus japonicus]